MSYSQTKKRPEVEEVCKGLWLSDSKLCEICDRLLISIKKGLSKEGHPTAAVKCFQTFVQDFPTGNERGKFIALDFGGTNFRVLLITLNDNKKFDIVKEKYEVPAATKQGPGAELFDYIAQCVEDFCKKHSLVDVKTYMPMGFTFSFPLNQIGLDKGILVKWTKGFNATDVQGNDVVQLLREALGRRKLHSILTPVAVLNDTTGTLMSSAMINPDTRVGLIVGTGSNACYTEKIENIENFKGDPRKPLMIINCEMGNFGADGVLEDIQTEFDKDIDSRSSHRQEQVFEKLIAGRYLGEIMRLVLLKLIDKKILFGGERCEKLEKAFGFGSENLTYIESESDGTFEEMKKILAKYEIKKYTDQDLIDVRYVSEAVSRRSAALSACAVATLFNKMGNTPVTAGVDGTVYRQHPKFKTIMEDKIRCLLRPDIQFKLALSEDGSGLGAAFVAAVLQSSEFK